MRLLSCLVRNDLIVDCVVQSATSRLMDVLEIIISSPEGLEYCAGLRGG